jgi:hypothetical protein
VKRTIASLFPLCLLACAKQAPNPIEGAVSCIESQVPNGKKVSAERAREVVQSCETKLDAWSRYSIEGLFKRRFRESDREMTAAFSKHRAAARKHWLTHLSDEIQPSFNRL